jgi:glutamate carboxypeptidase
MPAAVTPEQVLDHFRTRRDDFVEYTKRLVRAESPPSEPLLVRRAMRILERSLTEAGYRARVVPGQDTGGVLLAVPSRRARGRPVQLLVGHCDTVWPQGTIEEMPVRVDNRRLRGPGVFDMKGGLAQMVFAVEATAALGLEPSLTPVVMITSDEEAGSIESRPIIERLARRCERAFVLEPALGLAGRLKTRRKGTGHFEVKVLGKASHAGVAPEEGASAILELSHVIQRLFKLNDPQRGITVNVGTVAGGVSANVVAPQSCASVDVRVTTAEDARRIEETIRSLKPAIPGVSLEITGEMDREPMEQTPRNRALWDLARSLGRDIGLDLEEGASGGASDGNFTSQHTATLDGLGAVGDGAHAQREYINIDETLERAALLTLLLLAPSVKAE